MVSDDSDPFEQLHRISVEDPVQFMLDLFPHFDSVAAHHRLWVNMAELLLQLLTQHRLPAVDPDELQDFDFELGVGEAVALIGPTGSSIVATEVCTALEGWIRRRLRAIGRRPDRALLIARQLAEGIDATQWETFRDSYLASGSHDIEPMRAHPVGHLARRWLGELSANTRPERLPRLRADRLRHLHLGDPISAYARFTIDHDCNGRLAPLANLESLRVATCHLNDMLEAFDITVEGEAFVNRGSLDREEQVGTAKLLLERAAELAAHIVVFPEYALRWEDRDELREFLPSLSPRPLVVVGGTSLVESSEQRFNEAVLWIGDDEFMQQKVFPAEIMHLSEGITSNPSPQFVVWCSADLAMSILICRDAASPDVVAQLANVGVSLCLVPAFTDRVASLAGSLGVLRTWSQAFVVLANTSVHLNWPRPPLLAVDVVVDGPYEDTLGPLIGPPPDSSRPEGAGVWLFESSDRSLVWNGL